MDEFSKVYLYHSRSFMNAVLCLVCGTFALVLGVVFFMGLSHRIEPPWLLVGLLWVAFTVAFAWYAYGLFSPFAQRIEVSMAKMKWMSARCPVVEGEIEFSSVKSMVIRTDSDGLPAKMTLTLKSGEEIRIPFAHVLGRDPKPFVETLKRGWPNLEISIS